MTALVPQLIALTNGKAPETPPAPMIPAGEAPTHVVSQLEVGRSTADSGMRP